MTLQEFFAVHPKLALAFSGGTDSAFLLWAAREYGADVRPYFARSAFQPAFEYADARRLCEGLGAALRTVELDVLALPQIAANAEDRCYHCKRAIFAALRAAARADGYETLADGTNASDAEDDRPGMRALRELGVLSPLRLCGLTKEEIRARSREAGLFTADKPAYACLATRVPAGEPVTAEKLERVERAEGALFALGYSDLRVRLRGGGALLQLPGTQLERAREGWDAIRAALCELFDEVRLDPVGRESR